MRVRRARRASQSMTPRPARGADPWTVSGDASDVALPCRRAVPGAYGAAMIVFVAKLAVTPTGRAPYTLYLVHEENGDVADAIRSSREGDDAKALAAIATKWKGARLACAHDLAAAGVPLGFTPGEPPPGAARYRAAHAVIRDGHRSARVSIPVAIELMDAATTFLRSEPWKRSSTATRFAARASVTGEGGVARVASLVLRITEIADGPGVELCDSGEFEAVNHPEWERRCPMRLNVTLAFSPTFAAKAVEEAFGDACVPRIAFVADGGLIGSGDGEALLLAAALRAVASDAGEGEGEAQFEERHVRVEVDRSRAVLYEPPPAGSGLANRELARATAQALYAANPDEDLSEVACVVLDPREGFARDFAALIDRALGNETSAEERAARARANPGEERWSGTWLPMAFLAEHFVEWIGPEGAEFLRQPLTAYAARVLLVVGSQSQVFDVDVEPGEALRAKSEMDELHQARALLPEIERGLKPEQDAPEPPPLPPFEGTWRDGRGYLPKELAPDWIVRDVDARGVVTVGTGEGVSFQLGVVRKNGKRLVNVMIMREDASKPTRAQVDAILPRLRGCGKFGEVEMVMGEGERTMPMPGIRCFSARMAGDGVA